jgi:lipoprotein-anchoring transpeptidase ErfK/SrfK
VQFRTASGDSPLQSGTALDVSRDGLHIRTSAPLPEGTPLEIEIYGAAAQPGDRPMLLRGDVARVTPAGSGHYAMGVVLRVMPPSPGRVPPAPFPNPEAARAAAQTIGQTTRQMHADDRSPSVDPRDLAQQPVPPPSHTRRRVIAAATALALFLLALWLVPTILSEMFYEDSGLRSRAAQQTVPAPSGQQASPLLPPESESNPASGIAKPDQYTATYLSTLPLPQLPPAFEALLADAESASESPEGNAGGPLGTHALLGMGIGAPPEGGGDPGFGMGGPETDPMDLARKVGPEHVQASAMAVLAPSNSAAAPNEVRIDIDKSDFALTLLRGDRILRSIPVGLGANDATPEGEFVIANKLTDPHWYNRGNPVPPGDPNNPIGKRWMGLGDDGGATPYGLHPTSEPESIGQQKSRGCVRLRPEDAERIFRLCPVGTRVSIHP